MLLTSPFLFSFFSVFEPFILAVSDGAPASCNLAPKIFRVSTYRHEKSHLKITRSHLQGAGTILESLRHRGHRKRTKTETLGTGAFPHTYPHAFSIFVFCAERFRTDTLVAGLP